MNELFARLTNLSYEIFGVILPGMVLNIFLLLWWMALGIHAPTISASILPSFSFIKLQHLLESFTFATGLGATIPILTTWYFLGHLVLWITRSGPRVDVMALNAARRVGNSLIFRIPKPNTSYDEKLSALYNVVCREFTSDNVVIEWRQFYPLAKCFISQRLPTSLVVTYQNKYTFHRSVVGAGALIFWLAILSLILVFATSGVASECNSIVLLILLALGCLAIVWGFSSSYIFHWLNFGNSLVTESYSLINNPRNEDDQQI